MTVEDRVAALESRVDKLEKFQPISIAKSAWSIIWPTIKTFTPGILAALLFVWIGGSTLSIPGCPHPPNPPAPPVPPPIPPVPPSPPAPIPGVGFRVLIMYDKDTLTPEQQGIVFGRKVRDYLDSKCVVGADGKTPDRRIYPYGVDASGEAQWIRDVIQKHPGQKSWMVVSDGKTGYDGDLPKNADEAMAILTKIGG
jgi:hypothetical protein